MISSFDLTSPLKFFISLPVLSLPVLMAFSLKDAIRAHAHFKEQHNSLLRLLLKRSTQVNVAIHLQSVLVLINCPISDRKLLLLEFPLIPRDFPLVGFSSPITFMHFVPIFLALLYYLNVSRTFHNFVFDILSENVCHDFNFVK